MGSGNQSAPQVQEEVADENVAQQGMGIGGILGISGAFLVLVCGGVTWYMLAGRKACRIAHSAVATGTESGGDAVDAADIDLEQGRPAPPARSPALFRLWENHDSSMSEQLTV